MNYLRTLSLKRKHQLFTKTSGSSPSRRCLTNFSYQVLTILTWEILLNFCCHICYQYSTHFSTVIYLIKWSFCFLLWPCHVLCLHFYYIMLVTNLYECLKVKEIITIIFKVPEVTKKIVVEEKVRVPEEPKFPPAKGTCLCWITTNIKIPSYSLTMEQREGEILPPSMPQ